MDDSLKQVEACYDQVAAIYAAKFTNELEHKPLDRDLLNRFADRNGRRGMLCDLGCGPGHVAAYLYSRGCEVTGIDLSAPMIAEAAKRFPGPVFRQGNMLELKDIDEGSFAGVTAFYSIVNLKEEETARALAEINRVLLPGGELLLSFHIGNHSVFVEKFLEQEAPVHFYFYEPDTILACLEQLGFERVDAIIRYPYPDVEFASKRAYIHARRKT